MITRPREGPFFFARNLLRWGLAELFSQLGNLAPGSLAIASWRLAIKLNPHHEVAAINLATALAEGSETASWAAFERCLQQLENRHQISASDLYLSRWPGRLARRLAARGLWGGLATAHPQEAMHDSHDAVLQTALCHLAGRHCGTALQAREVDRAQRSLDVWRSLAGETVEVRWAKVELAWLTATDGDTTVYAPQFDDNLQDLLHRGAFVSPLDSISWGERFLAHGCRDEARVCFDVARRWLPEEAATWRGVGHLAAAAGDPEEARRHWRRALSRQPQDETTQLALLELDTPGIADSGPGSLSLQGPARLDLDAEHVMTARLEGIERPDRYTLHLLPPTGWGLIAQPRHLKLNAQGEASFRLVGRRPHRLLGRAWTLIGLAVGPEGHHRAELATEVVETTDSDNSRVLLTITEDHEIHEERGLFTPEQLHRVLVEKSRVAADLGVPWTHMVEVGSVLSMPQVAMRQGDTMFAEAPTAGAWHRKNAVSAGAWHHKDVHPQVPGTHNSELRTPPSQVPGTTPSAGAWHRLWTAIRRHLVEEVVKGHDLQPHLHTFNDPAYGHFPYGLETEGWRPSYPFLLTDAQRRGDFATVCPPPGHPPQLSRGWDRLRAVERAVAQLESIGRLGDASYRPLLWRSGLLEYGEDAADRAWSGVALRRAGLLADSDIVRGPSSDEVPTAFMTGWPQPFEARADGPLLQLPIAANLEGSYLQGHRRLQRLARRCCDAVRGRPGVHLFTLLTHDKFINARRGRDEFRYDPDYGDWSVIRQHLEAWQAAGAEVVTAAEGVQRVLDDRACHLQAVLRDETFVAVLPEANPTSSDSTSDPLRVRYRLQWLGRGIEVSAEYPQQVWVPLPCSWRPQVRQVSLLQGDHPLPVTDVDRQGFWLEVDDLATPVECYLELEGGVRPLLVERLERQQEGAPGKNAWQLCLRAEQPFRAARLLIPWHSDFGPMAELQSQVHCQVHCQVHSQVHRQPHGRSAADDGSSIAAATPTAHAERDGLLLTGLAFVEGKTGILEPLDLLVMDTP